MQNVKLESAFDCFQANRNGYSNFGRKESALS